LLIFKVALPELVTVTVWAVLVVPTFWPANVRLPVDRPTAAPVPVPVKVALCGLPLALSETLTVPVRLPMAAGVKVTLIVQLPPAATEVPQVLVWAKSLAFVPPTEMAAIDRLAPPVLVRVIVCTGLAVESP